MPYGCLDCQKLSEASLKALENALGWWQKSMRISKNETFLVLASYTEDTELELRLRKEVVLRTFSEEEFSKHVVTLSAKDEENLAHKITRTRTILPIETLTVFVESRHALSIRPIFRRKFSSALEIKTFKANFEFNHRWISTSSSLTWLLWNFLLRVRFKLRERMGRRLRKRLRSLFWS
ncbi:MAG: hypothetical protein ACE5HC_11310 [Candidatus Binatia bacterium]